MNCNVVIADNGVEALRRLDEVAPDLIISDVMMPEIDGYELLQALRANPRTTDIPIILLTARGREEDIVYGFEFGADDYLVKPVSMAELKARVKAKLDRPPIPASQLRQDRRTGLLKQQAFMQEAQQELSRLEVRDETSYLACIGLGELASMKEYLGSQVDVPVFRQLVALTTFDALPLETMGYGADNHILLLMPQVSTAVVQKRLRLLSQRVAKHKFIVDDEQLRLTPVIGFAPSEAGDSAEQLYDRALSAHSYAGLQLDLEPAEYRPLMGQLAHQTKVKTQAMKKISLRTSLARNGRTIIQISVTLFIGLVLPFIIYIVLGAVGFDISQEVYFLVVIGLLATAVLIWWEGLKSLRRVDPPEIPSDDYPAASAIIAVYLPNEAATIESTIQAFLQLDYPGPLQVILAYNTPRDMFIEKVFQEITQSDKRFTAIRIKNSTSKAQNVNAALASVSGKFVGIFDADHHPDPEAFRRAWRWLANGYDIVQGHCLVRNGASSWIARTVAIEFEGIYAVSHPGRARLHGFGIFGGSNGFWKTDLLRETRMHGFMLTEDIDSTFRVLERGYKIASDPYLISRELAPISVKALWNQRMRWAQGWFQVSLKQILPLLHSSKLSRQQKTGILQLLVWREIYPWVSWQIFPIVGYWAWSMGGFHRIDWFVPILVITTIVTLGTGPAQLIFIWRVADEAIKQHGRWFWSYLVVSFFFYTEFKNLVARVAQVKEAMGERVWQSTPRR